VASGSPPAGRPTPRRPCPVRARPLAALCAAPTSRTGAGALELDATHEADCETATPLGGIYCAGGALGLGEGTGALDLEVDGQSTRSAEGRDEGA